MKTGMINIGWVLVLCTTLVGCQTTNTSASSSAESNTTEPSAITFATNSSQDTKALASDDAQSNLEMEMVRTLIKRLHARFYRSHLNQSLTDSERAVNLFNSIVETEITGQCLFTPTEVQSLREQTQSAMLTEANKGEFAHGHALFTRIDQRHIDKLTYQFNTLNHDSNTTINVSPELAECWQNQLETDKQWLTSLGYASDAINTFLNDSYESKRNALASQSLKQHAERWAFAYAKGYGKENGYLPANQGPNFIDGEEGIGVMLKSHHYGAEVVGGSAIAVNTDLTVGDVLVAYADNKQAMVPLLQTTLNEVIELIRGEPGSQLKLWVYQPETDAIRVVQATRSKSARKSGISYTLEADNQIALIRLSSITVGVSAKLAAITDKLQQQGTDTMILDLRSNGGGPLAELSKILGQLGVNGEAYALRYIDRVSFQKSEAISAPFTGKIIVLVNQTTGGGAELLAATLQDYGRALIVGENTYGQGTVQQYRSLDHIYDLFDEKLGYVSYTIATLHHIDGTLLHGRGVTPDVVIPQGQKKAKKLASLNFEDIDTGRALPSQGQKANTAKILRDYSHLKQSRHSEEETTALTIDIAIALDKS
ncbi:S41 family peptidase [Vibrio sp. CAU 1672]|uniref:S41 family peptidase n=1 Tax=Vibrio sp. CAU 1672 TaxID=3032594 RepID=UPI0023D99A8E|nr:S41 family peptidase [Vibrio sp. CAU 1672]MDF2154860.1 S41 family peptidase [Vibrio sp. CAU 1672]